MKCAVILSILFSFSSSFAALNKSTLHRCSTKNVESLDVILVENQLNFKRAQRNFIAMNTKAMSTVTIPVYVHVLAKGKTHAEGYLSEDKVKQQIAVLNQAYNSININFELAEVDYTVNETWFNAGIEDEVDMKTALHKGDATSLNLYTSAGGGLLGWSSFPWDYSKEPELDGVVIAFESLPEGEMPEYNLGFTAVHEVGHWLGLFHTFQGGCKSGDLVKDTPAEAGPSYGCPKVAPDSCPNDNGLDPIQNFMDYSDDRCMDQFSHGQMERIHDTISTYRK